MLTILNSQSLWIGTDLKTFNNIRDTLDAAKIPYKYKTKNKMAQWIGTGTLRGRTGSLGNPPDLTFQYEILVHKNDHEKATHVIQP